MAVRVEIEYAPAELFHRLQDLRHAVFLDSARFHARNGCYSFLAADPVRTFASGGDRIAIDGCADFRSANSTPWQALGKLLNAFGSTEGVGGAEPFQGAAFGFFSYEMGRHLERLPPPRPLALEAPEAWFGFYDVVLTFDHRERRGWLVSTGRNADGTADEKRARLRCDQFQEILQRPRRSPPSAAPLTGAVRSLWTPMEHAEAVRRALAYIRAGDIYQVNLTYPFRGTTDLSPADLYLRLRTGNPAPFAGYLDFGEGQIISSSPERFLRMDGRKIQSRPIKGTCARTGNSSADRAASDELLRSAKNRAELLMITDLLRNDLGRVCDYGSVTVPDLVECEEYETVYHLVATVEGRLRDGVTHLDALAACFPGGSITGAPKIRAMEIIHELEPRGRGIYTGCLGYFGFNGISDFNILIRTILHREGQVCFSVGGGIVADSDPVLEYKETLDKARGILSLWPR
jgi:para-aminobenzoate synthetase component 1